MVAEGKLLDAGSSIATRKFGLSLVKMRSGEGYGFSLKDIINLLDPQSGRRAPVSEARTSTRKPRQIKIYKNPHSGEIVETKGGNHKTLKEWKAQYGANTVESWLAK